MGALVIVVNAEKVAVSGKKWTQKLYRTTWWFESGDILPTTAENSKKNN